MSTKVREGWWASLGVELYTSGPHATRDEAILAGADEFCGDAYYIVEAGMHAVRFSAERLIDEQYFECEDYFDGDHSEPDRRGNHKAADAELQEMLDAWIARHADTFVAPCMFAWSRNEELIPAGAVGEQEAA